MSGCIYILMLVTIGLTVVGVIAYDEWKRGGGR